MCSNFGYPGKSSELMKVLLDGGSRLDNSEPPVFFQLSTWTPNISANKDITNYKSEVVMSRCFFKKLTIYPFLII